MERWKVGSVAGSADKAVEVVNPRAASPFLLVCDHASNRFPEPYGDLGLGEAERVSHAAWDPGALAVSLALSGLLDATLVHSTISRLIIDCNRALDAPDLICTQSETVRIPANENLDDTERGFRIAAYYQPFHEAVAAVVGQRRAQGRETILICMHSFTPVYFGVGRPWPIGLIHGHDERFAAAVADALKARMPKLELGWNQPYSAADGVTLTLERHGDVNGLASVMIELRNDELTTPAAVSAWAERLASALIAARNSLDAREPAGLATREG